MGEEEDGSWRSEGISAVSTTLLLLPPLLFPFFFFFFFLSSLFDFFFNRSYSNRSLHLFLSSFYSFFLLFTPSSNSSRFLRVRIQYSFCRCVSLPPPSLLHPTSHLSHPTSPPPSLSSTFSIIQLEPSVDLMFTFCYSNLFFILLFSRCHLTECENEKKIRID